MNEPKPLRLLQEIRCPGKCQRELYEGLDCHHGTCEYHIHDPFNSAHKAQLLAAGEWLPVKVNKARR